MERQGIPSVALCTTGFLNAAAMKAKMLGIPNLPVVGVPLPFASLPPEQARARGAQVYEAIVTAITTSEV